MQNINDLLNKKKNFIPSKVILNKIIKDYFISKYEYNIENNQIIINGFNLNLILPSEIKYLVKKDEREFIDLIKKESDISFLKII